jgi:ergothioneine biosynthesis protein EgtB
MALARMGNADRTADLGEEYRRIRQATEELCAPLEIEDYGVQSMPEASPAKWHLAHTTWFFEEFVCAAWDAGYERTHALYRQLFNSYYVSIGPAHPRAERGLLTRPTVREVYRYREQIDEHLLALCGRRIDDAELAGRILLGLQHEQQHQELLLTDLKHAFWRNPLRPAYLPAAHARPAGFAPLAFVDCGGGLREIGYAGTGFCFDNEQPAHRVWAEPYRLASRPVSNSEFREFVRDAGYRRADLWLSDGWDAVQREGWARPLYWSQSLDSEFTLSGETGIDPHAPVSHISFYEAQAFSRWAGARLPSEAEWELVAKTVPVRGNFVEGGRMHPAPMDSAESGAVSSLFGDVWEWTASPYGPYPGYSAARGALGEYNGKFMANQFVLRGGSCATPRGHVRASYRNFLDPKARWQFSGVRLAKDVS